MSRRPRPKIVTLTDAAAARVREVMEKGGKPYLRVGVNNGGCAGMEYTMDYAEAIAPASPSGYRQPLHLADHQRQPLYRLGQRLLSALSAPPAVYLLQFGYQGDRECFDRLWPFPAPPAIASLGTQTPDLFSCHWHCLRGQPLRDIVIRPPVDPVLLS